MTDMNKEDRDLAEIFSGEDRPLHPDTLHIPLGKTAPKKEAPKKEQKPVTEQWELEKPLPNSMDKLKACVKSTFLFGGLSLMFFYFQQSGQMDMSAAMPCICACCVLAGWGVGKNAR